MKKSYTVLWFTVLTIAYCFGFEEKSFLQKYFDIILSAFGGGSGGYIGWVIIGALGLAGSFGGISIGVLTYIFVGMFSCVGIASFIHILIDPNNYNKDYPFILTILVIGVVATIYLYYYNRRVKNGHQQVLEESNSQSKCN